MLAAALFACTGVDVNNPPPAVLATWAGGTHILPSSATRSGRSEFLTFVRGDPEGWGERVARDIVKPGVKVTAVVYLHSCSGPGGRQWAAVLEEFGLGLFGPNSYARPGRRNYCDVSGQIENRNRLRNEEARYAAHQLLKQPWIDPERLILVGFSEGAYAHTVATSSPPKSFWRPIAGSRVALPTRAAVPPRRAGSPC